MYLGVYSCITTFYISINPLESHEIYVFLRSRIRL